MLTRPQELSVIIDAISTSRPEIVKESDFTDEKVSHGITYGNMEYVSSAIAMRNVLDHYRENYLKWQGIGRKRK
jgi:hypothetical protein